MRQVVSPDRERTFSDKLRELDSLHTAALQEKEATIATLMRENAELRKELEQLKKDRNRSRLSQECATCLYRVQYLKGEGKAVDHR